MLTPVLPSSFGLHLFKLEEKEAAELRSLAEVRAEIRQTLARRKAEDDFSKVQQAAEDALNLGLSFEELAGRFKAEVKRTGLRGESEAVEMVGLHSGARRLLQDAVSGMTPPAEDAGAAAENSSAALVLPVPLDIVDGIALVAVEQAKPAGIRPLEEVREEIRNTLKRDAALRLAHAAAVEARPAFSGETAPEAFRSGLLRSEPFSRALPTVPGLEGSDVLAGILLSSSDKAWLPDVQDTARGAVIARVAELVPTRDEDWRQAKDAFMAQFLRIKANQAAISFLQNLVAGADIVQPEGILEQLSYR
jgi:peptidyl-prolyl cis-trans isomerase D